jgi:hypothetical protein
MPNSIDPSPMVIVEGNFDGMNTGHAIQLEKDEKCQLQANTIK